MAAKNPMQQPISQGEIPTPLLSSDAAGRLHKSGYPSFINHRTAAAEAAAAVFCSARHSRENNKIDDKLCLLTRVAPAQGVRRG